MRSPHAAAGVPFNCMPHLEPMSTPTSLPPAALLAALADRYAIERELGAGGMATVYLAQDLKHHRKVALKVLRPDLAATMGADRFLREVTIAANLQHPHILPLYDSGEAGGFLYFVMPYIEGQTLRDRLHRERELPVADAVRILRDVTDAMATAHAKGVVHRDLKPENIMLSGRHALVADFGVAKAVSEATGRNTLTTAGVALGTPSYMAPEQATADPLTDHRADLYALGVIAYEVLTGQPPFVRGTPQALLAAHVTEAPVAVTERRSAIPAPLATIIMRCLEKKPADRPQNADELLAVLETLMTSSGGMTPTDTRPVQAVTPPAAAAPVVLRRWVRPVAIAAGIAVLALGAWFGRGLMKPKSNLRKLTPIVVLPFEVRTSDPALQSMGIDAAERIAGAIQQAAIGEVVPYRSEDKSAIFTAKRGRAVVQETGAGTLVVGTITQRGAEIELEARVVRAGDLKTIWTLGPVRGASSGSTVAIDTLIQRVLGAAGYYVSPGMAGLRNPSAWRPPPSLAVLRAYVQAEELFRRGEYTKALPFMLEAAALDTTWLYASLFLRDVYANIGQPDKRAAMEAYLVGRRARLTTGEALYLDEMLAELGSPEQQFRASTARFEADSVFTYGVMWSAASARRPKDALRFYALRDTTTAWGRDWQPWFSIAANAYHLLGQYDEELALIRDAKARAPRKLAHWRREVRALAVLKRFPEVDRLAVESHVLENPAATAILLADAANEASSHGTNDRARDYARQALAALQQWPDSLRPTVLFRNNTRALLRILGDRKAVLALYDQEAKERGAGGVGYRVLAARDRILAGDTTGALALVDSVRKLPQSAFAATWENSGAKYYYGSQVLALLGRKEEAVAMLRDALNNGFRLGTNTIDEPLQWCWVTIKDYPPFMELMKLR